MNWWKYSYSIAHLLFCGPLFAGPDPPIQIYLFIEADCTLTKSFKESSFGNAVVFLKAPTQSIYRIVLSVQEKHEPVPPQPPTCISEVDAIYRTDFPKMSIVHEDQRYLQGSSTMHHKSYSQTSSKANLSANGVIERRGWHILTESLSSSTTFVARPPKPQNKAKFNPSTFLVVTNATPFTPSL